MRKRTTTADDGSSSSSITSIGDAQVPREQIAVRAYELYLQRGANDGRDVEDWLQAERELIRQEVVSLA